MSENGLKKAVKRIQWEHQRTNATIEQISKEVGNPDLINSSKLQSILTEELEPTFKEYVALVAIYEKLPTQRRIKLTEAKRKRLFGLLRNSSLQKDEISEALDLSSDLQKELSNDFEGSYPVKVLKEEYDELVKYLQNAKRGRIVITLADQNELEEHLIRSGLSFREAISQLHLDKPSPNTLRKWIYGEVGQSINQIQLARVKEAFESLPDKVIELELEYGRLLRIDPVIYKL
ncbi:MAG: hypothetical protein AAFY41_11040, partial [Bacteroidota bacterium]